MEQKDKDLLLQDLCARLPYGVIVETSKGSGHICDINLTIFGTEVGVNINPTSRDKFNVEECKPYLFPLSRMTEEQENELLDILEDKSGDEFEYKVVDFYNKNHFDYRGLIEKGLAIEAPKGMYN